MHVVRPGTRESELEFSSHRSFIGWSLEYYLVISYNLINLLAAVSVKRLSCLIGTRQPTYSLGLA